MKKLLYIALVFTLLTAISLPANAGMDFSLPNAGYTEQQPSENMMTIDVYVNGSTIVRLENVPINGLLDVYSILGVKVTSVNLKNHTGSCSIDLPKGIYILKAGKVAKKIVVR